MTLALLRHRETSRLDEARPILAIEAILGELDRPETKMQNPNCFGDFVRVSH